MALVLRKLTTQRKGQSVLEYALLLAAIAVVVMSAYIQMGTGTVLPLVRSASNLLAR